MKDEVISLSKRADGCIIGLRATRNEPTPRAKARGFRTTDMIWHNYRRCSLMYRRTTSSSTLPTVSAKYPSAQKLSPHKNSSSSGYSFLITRLVPPFSLCTTSATLSLWLRLDDKMYVVLLDTQLTDPPLIHPACFVQQLSQADDHFASQYTPTIFRYPHQVVLQAVFRMGPSLISGHSQIMSEFAPLRQVPPGFASKGCHSSPGLKAWGFLAYLIKRYGIRGLLLLSLGLSFFPQLVYKQTHLVRADIRDRIFRAEIQKISEPLLKVRAQCRRNGSFIKNGVEPRQNGIRDRQHRH